MAPIIKVPEQFLLVKYAEARVPGVSNSEDLELGANCQLFAYQFLLYYGKWLPPFRSSELWEDTAFTSQVFTIEPLDLLLFNKEDKAWGAHMGVALGEGVVIHLSKEIGSPVVWTFAEFANHLEYAYFIGAKRVLANTR